MKKFIIAVVLILLAAFALTYVRFGTSVIIDLTPDAALEHTVRQNDKSIQMLGKDGEWHDFEIRGIDMGAGQPGHYATDYSISKETYLRWFREIKDMGANTIRVYILLGSNFYQALWEFNHDNPDPLYVIHGVWIDDYVQNSHLSGYDNDYQGRFKEDCRTVVDAIHGQRLIELGRIAGTGTYSWDVSPWVIGYILGVEWEAPTVAYTDHLMAGHPAYEGRFVSSTDEASPFETMLAQVGDDMLAYEAARYHEQRLLAFTNWPTTDPIYYPEALQIFFEKYDAVDVEHIKFSQKAVAGTFASYHIYPYYPDYLDYIHDYDDYRDASGQKNTYRAYLETIVNHHSCPVVISEYGVPSSRGKAQNDANTGRNQGGMSEDGQGAAIVRCYHDLMDAGCAGSIVFTWQDEWFKRTWNTMGYTDLQSTPYWSDYQTNEQYFGVLSFDPGESESVCYVDGNIEEWNDGQVLGEADGRTLSCTYDEKFLYLMVKGADLGPNTPLYLPIDTTQKSGSLSADLAALTFDRPADFVIALNGTEDSRVMVQARYEAERAMFGRTLMGIDPFANPPAKDSNSFKPIDLPLQTITDTAAVRTAIEHHKERIAENFVYQSYETGKLTYGNANPSSREFNSMADFCYGDGCVEIKLPWGLLNFADPSTMRIHDDYYDCYGVDFMPIKAMHVGIGSQGSTIHLMEKPLTGWGESPTSHERLKESYYYIQKLWAGQTDESHLNEPVEPAAPRSGGDAS